MWIVDKHMAIFFFFMGLFDLLRPLPVFNNLAIPTSTLFFSQKNPMKKDIVARIEFAKDGLDEN